MKHRNVKLAKAAAIGRYQACIVSEESIFSNGVLIAGAHIWPSGANRDLSCYDENIIPLVFRLHYGGKDTFDDVIPNQKSRTPIEKIYWILEHCKDEYRNKLQKQLYELVEILRSIPRHEKSSYIVGQILDERFK